MDFDKEMSGGSPILLEVSKGTGEWGGHPEWGGRHSVQRFQF